MDFEAKWKRQMDQEPWVVCLDWRNTLRISLTRMSWNFKRRQWLLFNNKWQWQPWLMDCSQQPLRGLHPFLPNHHLPSASMPLPLICPPQESMSWEEEIRSYQVPLLEEVPQDLPGQLHLLVQSVVVLILRLERDILLKNNLNRFVMSHVVRSFKSITLCLSLFYWICFFVVLCRVSPTSSHILCLCLMHLVCSCVFLHEYKECVFSYGSQWKKCVSSLTASFMLVFLPLLFIFLFSRKRRKDQLQTDYFWCLYSSHEFLASVHHMWCEGKEDKEREKERKNEKHHQRNLHIQNAFVSHFLELHHILLLLHHVFSLISCRTRDLRASLFKLNLNEF